MNHDTSDGLTMRLTHRDLDEALRPSSGPAPELVVGRDARWLTLPDGRRLSLLRYGPLRRILDRLVAERLDGEGRGLSAEALIEAGWPGERMLHSAGLLRVYTAVRRLRRLGLAQALLTRDDGYVLDPDVPVRRDVR